ncbi:hypothetical protein [Pontibaca methylaminivorans]|uniref:Tat (Twin-arginine translocation) pathway signal sequence n=1 Tax=Pontibaca methylaminivorans TaxID=515897 RepID=A0A1R3WB97_9RHOB|nr:hypothetical protein [Pontibaca methylaminivorans]SIT75316.1 hypothetical protein SAMN05421849_0308 [Pontibaca methylaminivorans]
MNRRTFLAAAPAAAAGGVLPASAEPETPVMKLFREWQRLESAAHAAEGDEYERLHDLRWENEKRMIREPSRSALDVLLKITAWTGFGEGDLEHDSPYIPIIWEEARALVS